MRPLRPSGRSTMLGCRWLWAWVSTAAHASVCGAWSNVLRLRVSGIQGFRGRGVRGCRDAGIQGCRHSGIQGFMGSG
eukprot:10341887-Alexandrium_andersonii.AAC.1